MFDIIEKYFKGERTLFFQSSDLHKMIEGDTYLRYEFKGSVTGEKVVLWFGGNNGEFAVKVCSTPEKLEKLIQSIIY